MQRLRGVGMRVPLFIEQNIRANLIGQSLSHSVAAVLFNQYRITEEN